MLYIELYDKNNDSFSREINITQNQDIIRRIVPPNDLYIDYCNPIEISYDQFIELKKNIKELHNYHYEDFDWYVQERKE